MDPYEVNRLLQEGEKQEFLSELLNMYNDRKDEDGESVRHQTCHTDKTYLETFEETSPFTLTKSEDIVNLLDDYTRLGFQARTLGQAAQIWRKSIEERSLIWLGITGSVVPAGLNKVLMQLIENGLIDVIVSTGAQMAHSMVESLGFKHYLGNPGLCDKTLYNKRIDRYYDIIGAESDLWAADGLCEVFMTRNITSADRTTTTRQFYAEFGEWLNTLGFTESVVAKAQKYNVPIYVPAFGDSMTGVMAMYQMEAEGPYPVIDSAQEIAEMSSMIGLTSEEGAKSSPIYLGGGVPKNYIQQAAFVSSFDYNKEAIHKRFIQITTAQEWNGGLSSCTPSEAMSWGKVASIRESVMVNSEVMLAFPLLAQYVYNFKRKERPGWNLVTDDVLSFEEFQPLL